MHHLTGHENIVELKELYEDKSAVYIVMEFCEGGELFEGIVKRGFYSEKCAAKIFRQVMKVVCDCHCLGVMHRDLKPENFLFSTADESSVLKAIDFGLSTFFKPGDVFDELVGSAYYVAPEVLKKQYGPKADIWSAGVILYILLTGVPPFSAGSEKETFAAILQGDIDYSSEPWPSISSSAKDLVKKMLQTDPKQRPSADEILKHPWLIVGGDASDKPMNVTVLLRMKRFTAMNRLKKVALKVVAENLSKEEIIGLKEIFKSMDVDKSGTITFDELKAGLYKWGTKLSDTEVRQLLESADVDGNGILDYMEFITATMHMNRMEKDNRLCKAFLYFDQDNSGYITMDELKNALEKYNTTDEQKIKEMLSEVDADSDGKINYEEFVAMMRSNNHDYSGNHQL